jgi:hypothetical protein
MTVSAVRVEIVGGTLPVKRFSKRSLRHNVSVRARFDRKTPGGAGCTAGPAW